MPLTEPEKHALALDAIDVSAQAQKAALLLMAGPADTTAAALAIKATEDKAHALLLKLQAWGST